MFFSKKSKSLQIMSPVDGIVEAIETVNDPVFSQKMIGDRTKKEYSVGQKLHVKLVSVDELEWVVNFEIIRERKGRHRYERRRKKS